VQEDLLATVVAHVGTMDIDLRAVKAEVNRIVPLEFFHARLPENQREETYRKALQSLIEKALMQQDAVARGLRATEDELRAEFHRTLAKAGPQYTDLSEDKFAELLEQYRPMVERRLLIDKNEARFEASVQGVSEQDLQDAYEARKAELFAPQEARFLHILAKVAPSAGAVRGEMEKLRQQIVAGESFADLARQYSDDIYGQQGGDMGFIAEGAFQIGELNKAAFALADGETSEVLSSLYGFHLLQRVETKAERPLSYEEAAPMLRQAMALERHDAARTAWIAQMEDAIGVAILFDLNDEILPQEDAKAM